MKAVAVEVSHALLIQQLHLDPSKYKIAMTFQEPHKPDVTTFIIEGEDLDKVEAYQEIPYATIICRGEMQPCGHSTKESEIELLGK